VADSPIILSEGSVGSKVMRGRDVDFMLRGRVEPQLLQVLVSLAEIGHTNMKSNAELATMLDQMTDIMQGMTDIAQNMKDRTQQMARAMGQMEEAADGNPEA
jgi:methyl-accepting chemotaxis protein